MGNRCPVVVLTRFNLAISFSTNKRCDSFVPMKKPWIDGKYLETRFEIFERYTFQAFVNQTDKNFDWIVLFHEATPECFKEKIKQYKKVMQQFEAVFLSDDECKNWVQVLNLYLKRKYPDSAIITTRIDNDDFIHKSFIESVKRQFETYNNIKILSYENGLQYDIRKKTVMKYKYVNNHFLSMYVCNTSEKENHVLYYDHTKIDQYVDKKEKLVKKSAIPLWIEIITETNYSNAFHWRLSGTLVPFDVKKEYPEIDFKGKNRIEWGVYCIVNLGLAFFNRSKGALKIVKEKYHSLRGNNGGF